MTICDDMSLFQKFSDRITYLHGPYDQSDHFIQVNEKLNELEQNKDSNRVFYLATPPSVFSPVVHSFQPHCMTTSGSSSLLSS